MVTDTDRQAPGLGLKVRMLPTESFPVFCLEGGALDSPTMLSLGGKRGWNGMIMRRKRKRMRMMMVVRMRTKMDSTDVFWT